MTKQAASGTAGSVIEHSWITMPDGCRLSARIWLPATDRDRDATPAVLEYIPYRKRDGTRTRDEAIHGHLAMHGYAAVRVDLRGSGESEGLMHDEYLDQELDDAVAVIAWIAAQPWCDGAVGMMGKSWGGFNALQVAARRPPALKAIVTVYSTDDRYADDIHYAGGCLLNDNLWWGSIMLAYSSRPPDPEITGSGWRAEWLQRLEALPFFSAEWLAHQQRDAFWRHGSVCEDFAAIECPVLAIGGWADGYSNTVFRLLEGLSVPCRGLIGPWAHIYPHEGAPGPAIDFLGELVHWWDRWLRNRQDGPERPKLQVWQQGFTNPAQDVVTAQGGWIAADTWPPPAPVHHALTLNMPDAPADPVLIRSPQTVGIAGGEWCGFGVTGEAPGDQRADEPGSFVWVSPILDAPLSILGMPVAELSLAAEAPSGFVCVRIGDVGPDGAVMRVSYGILNLTHRAGHAHAIPLVPGERLAVRVPLNGLSHRFEAGHRIHVAISTAYWPMLWPSPSAAGIQLFADACRILLPTRPAEAATPHEFAAPGASAGIAACPTTMIKAGEFTRTTIIDMVSGIQTMIVRGEGGVFGEGVLRLDDTGTMLDHAMTREFSIHPDDPLSARHCITQRYAMGRPGWDILIETITTMHADTTRFFIDGDVSVSEGGTHVFSRRWRRVIPRDGV